MVDTATNSAEQMLYGTLLALHLFPDLVKERLNTKEVGLMEEQTIKIAMDQLSPTEEPRRNTPLRLDNSHRFTTEAELSDSVVHQVNEPLTAMLLNAQAAKRWLTAEPPNLMEAIASIDRIERDARVAGQTVGQIQALVKQASLDKREASIPDLIGEAAVRLLLKDLNMCEVPIKRHCDENLLGFS